MIDIEKNYKNYIRYLKTYIERDGIDALIEWLDTRTDAKIAPASTRYHLSCEGGYIQHSLNVFINLINLLENAKNVYGFEYPKETIAIVALLHDISKVGFYKKIYKNVKNDETGKWEQVASYAVRDDDARLVYATHEENSLYVLNHFIKLTYEEQVAIRYHMGTISETADNFETNRMITAYKKCPLALYLHMADMMSMCIDEDTTDNKDVRKPIVKEEKSTNDGENKELSTELSKERT